ncbi:MAG: DegT/DnrJ/EryC1/StrS family aminotransferase [Alphaproteobacteria bacterium]
MQGVIPVLKPKLPEISAILPYLQQIDENRWYGNNGPLVVAFEKRLAELLKATPDSVLMVANGTLGLTVALQALEVKRGGLCIMPSWTFTATPAAALAAGLEPCFIDVDKESQVITVDSVKKHIKSLKKPVSAVMPVSAFGAPLDVAQWDRFTEETGIPVVIDAAAAFDSMVSGAMKIGRTPVMISLHATKICGIGEGGLMLTKSADVAFRLRRIINFGFENDRLSHRIAINAKPSEYNAAVAMAVLDQWNDIRAAWAKVQLRYKEKLEAHGISCWVQPEWVTSTSNIIVPEQAVPMLQCLKEQGIDTRRWWETGCHVHPAYRACMVHGELPSTQWLGQSVLGIPSAIDLKEEAQDRVCDAIIAGLKALKGDARKYG